MDVRAAQLHTWLTEQLAGQGVSAPDARFSAVSGDASFRRYFRLSWQAGDAASSVIGVDAPPDKENSAPFLRVGEGLLSQGVRVPAVRARDLSSGFLMLDDFGDSLLRPQLSATSVDQLYGQAMQDLLGIQACRFDPPLPPYDEPLLMREMALFRDWFLGTHLGIQPSAEDLALLQAAFDTLAALALEQPRATVHRDYHSRNIMVLADGTLGHIDFQDAVHGPVTYDLVSLLRDCYVDWPAAQVRQWALGFAARLREQGVLAVDDARFLCWFDAMGAQRHLKAIGIFARLFHRDGKAGYLPDIPRTFGYLLQESAALPALHDFNGWLRERVVPVLEAKDPQASRYLRG
jgi:aminoglycoside/choline kinase family phosphotransferase